MNRHQRRAQYAVASRSKPLKKRSTSALLSEQRGRMLIEQFVMRGIFLTAGPAPAPQRLYMNRVAASVRHAVRGR